MQQMRLQSGTLLDLLAGSVPAASGSFGNNNDGLRRVASVTKNARYAELTVLKRWKDFGPNLVQRLFQRRVYQALTEERDDIKYISPPNRNTLKVNGESGCQMLVGETIQQHVQEALDKTSQVLIHQQLDFVLHDGGPVTLLYDDDISGPNFKQLRPDWGFQSSAFANNNILPGDSKWGWSSDHLKQVECSKQGLILGSLKECLWPLKQILTYCIKSNSRYGFIVTKEELVAVRCGHDGLVQQQHMDAAELRKLTQERGMIEWTSIKWSQQARLPHRWSVNLALYCLSLLAGANGRLVNTRVPFAPLDKEVVILPEDQPMPTPPRPFNMSSPETTPRKARAAKRTAGEGTSEATSVQEDSSLRGTTEEETSRESSPDLNSVRTFASTPPDMSFSQNNDDSYTPMTPTTRSKRSFSSGSPDELSCDYPDSPRKRRQRGTSRRA